MQLPAQSLVGRTSSGSFHFPEPDFLICQVRLTVVSVPVGVGDSFSNWYT